MVPEEMTIDRALSRFLDGEPEPEDGPALAAGLAKDAQFAREFRRLLMVDGLLRQAAEARSIRICRFDQYQAGRRG